MTQLGYDKHRVAQQFSRAAGSYAQHDQLQRLTGKALMARLPQHCHSLVDIGCGPASHSAELAQHTQLYLGIDLAAGMLAQAQHCQPQLQWLLADAEQLPLQHQSVTVIFANLALQWCNRLSASLQQCVQALQPQGQLLFSTVLNGSMEPLMSSMQQLDGNSHHNRLLTKQQLQQQLAEVAGISWQVEVHQYRISYSSVTAMLADIKGIGANYNADRSSGYFGKARWQALTQSMEKYRDSDDLLQLNWNIALINGRKPVNNNRKS